MNSLDWHDLAVELDRWTDEGLVAELWWRDDDAAEAGPQLARLLSLVEESRSDLALAVVPALSSDALAKVLEGSSRVVVIQHGFAHRNHAATGRRAVECGGARPVNQVLAELRDGFRRLVRLFGSQVVPILAPPWNRIEGPVVHHLPELGFRGLSTFGPRFRQSSAPGLVAVNAHIDPLDWRGPVRFAGRGKVIGSLIGELRDRRLRMVDRGEPLGLLTHHRDHDPETWSFIEHFLRVTRAHAAVRWLHIDEAFAPRDVGKAS